MEEFKIDSFKVNHYTLKKGIHVSRTDTVHGETITTYDIRFKKPNNGIYLSPAAAHTIEHYFATFLRKNYDGVIYFGPMGCLTGFYLIQQGRLSIDEIRKEILEACEYVFACDDIPGNSAYECGNYKMLDLDEARKEIGIFKSILENNDSL